MSRVMHYMYDKYYNSQDARLVFWHFSQDRTLIKRYFCIVTSLVYCWLFFQMYHWPVEKGQL